MSIDQSFAEARQLLKMSAPKAYQKIKHLNAKQATRLISEIRYLSRAKNPDIDRLYPLMHHLANIQATTLAQKRLENLLWVIGSSLFLFCSFFVYVLITQKRALHWVMQAHSEQSSSQRKSQEQSLPYRGE